MAKISLNDINDQLKENNWKLLSLEYKNLTTVMEFECPEGHKVFSTWGKLRNKFSCPVCEKNSLKRAGEQKLDRKDKKITLALDQATYTTGYSIYYDNELFKFGVFETKEEDFIKRCSTIKQWLISMIEMYRPDLIALEGIQLQEKSDSTRTMGVTVFQELAELLGALSLTCFEVGIRFKICPTNTWRSHCGVKGRSRADKKASMKQLVKKWYDISVTDDAADAIGIGKYASEIFNKKVDIVEWD